MAVICRSVYSEAMSPNRRYGDVSLAIEKPIPAVTATVASVPVALRSVFRSSFRSGTGVRIGLFLLAGLLLILLHAEKPVQASVPLPAPESNGAPAQVAESTGKLVLVPDDLYVGETTVALGFHLDFPDRAITIGYTEHFVPEGEECDSAEGGTVAFTATPARISLTACATGEGRVQLMETDTGTVIAEATATITQPDATASAAERSCHELTGVLCSPNAPTGLEALVLGQRDIAVTWDRLIGATKYKVEKVEERFGGSTETFEVTATGKSFIVDAGTEHTFRVQAFGNGSTWAAEWGLWSTPVTVTTEAPPTITIRRDSSSIEEGESAEFTLMADPAPSASLTINIDVTQDGEFLTSFRPSSVRLSRNSTTASLSLSTTDDLVDEDDGSIRVSIEDATGYMSYIVGDPDEADIDVNDNDPPEISVSAVASSINEGGTARFRIDATTAPTSNLTVHIDVGQTGDFLEDDSPPEEVVISTGRTFFALPLETEDDGVCEPDGSIRVTIGSDEVSTDYTVSGSSASAEVTVNSAEECTVTVISISGPASPVEEGNDAVFTIRANPAPSSDLEVYFSVSQSGSFLGQNLPQSPITITAGSDRVLLSVPTQPDTMDEENGSVTVTITDDKDGTDYTVGSPSSDSVTVTDDDPVITISGPSSSIVEGNDAEFTIQANGAPRSDITINIGVSDPGGFLSNAAPTSVILPIGDTSVPLPLATQVRTECEDQGAITVTIKNGTDYTVGSNDNVAHATVTSLPAHCVTVPVITIEADDDSIVEGEDAAFTIRANPAPSSDLEVYFSVSQSGSFLGQNLPQSPITITADSTQMELNVPTQPDTVDEDNGSVTVTITDDEDGTDYTVGSPSSDSVTVTDDDPVITISGPTSSIEEGEDAIFTIQANGTPRSSLWINVDVDDPGGFLRDPVPTRVRFLSGRPSVPLPLATRIRTECETENTITVTIEGGTNYTVGGDGDANVVVMSLPAHCVIVPVITITPGPSPITEGTDAVFTITATPQPSSNLTVHIDVEEKGKYLSGPARSTVTIIGRSQPADSRSESLRLPTSDDGMDEVDGEIRVTIEDDKIGTDYTVGDDNDASVTVQDDDLPVITISAVNSNITEEDDAQFTITATTEQAAALDVQISVTQMGQFLDNTQTLPSVATIPSGESSMTLTLDTDDDEVAEMAGFVTVTIKDDNDDTSNDVIYRVGSPNSQIVRVKSNDVPTPTILTNETKANEDNESIIILTWTHTLFDDEFVIEQKTSHLSSSWEVVPSGSISLMTETSRGRTVWKAEIEDITGGQTYYHQVKGKSGTNESAYSAEVDTDVPAVPTGLGSSTSNGEIILVWATADLADGYQVQRFESAATGYVDIPALDISISGTVATIDNLDVNGRIYIHRVRSTNSDGSSPWSDDVEATIVPGVPMMLTSTTGDGAIDLDWDDAAHSTGYDVQQWHSPSSTYSTLSFSPAITDSMAAIRDLNNTEIYLHRVKSKSNDGSSAWSSPLPTTIPLAAPTNLDVVPLPQRKARLNWTYPLHNPSGTTHEVQLKAFTESWPSPYPKSLTIDTSDSDYPNASMDLNLDDIYEPPMPTTTVRASPMVGLVNSTSYDIRMDAQHGSVTAYSEEIAIIDSPIISINGESGSTVGQASVKWSRQTGVTSYSIRWRKLEDDAGNNHHSSSGWQLDDKVYPKPPSAIFTGKEENISASKSSETIRPLDLGELYAVQLNYETSSGTVFSARDAYVWPSDSKPEAGERVAGYPFFGHFSDKTYRYRVCVDTFSPDDVTKQDQWISLLKESLEEWEIATHGFIQMTPDYKDMSEWSDPNEPEFKECTTYPSVWQQLVNPGIAFERRAEDDQRSEIRMLHLPDSIFNVGRLTNLGEMLLDPFKVCVLDAPACTTSYLGYDRFVREASTVLPSADITFNGNRLGSLTPVVPDSVRFNTCIDDMGKPDPDDHSSKSHPFYSYALAIHESGHALGLSDWSLSWTLAAAAATLVERLFSLAAFALQIPSGPADLINSALEGATDYTENEIYWASHPATFDSLMNYDSRVDDIYREPDCSPYPLDVMAIYSLYQTDLP